MTCGTLRRAVRLASRLLLVILAFVILLIKYEDSIPENGNLRTLITTTKRASHDAIEFTVRHLRTIPYQIPREYASSHQPNIPSHENDDTNHASGVQHENGDMVGNVERSSAEVSKRPDYCSPQGHIEATNCNYDTIESFNMIIYPMLQQIVETGLFRYWKVNLERECPYWQDDAYCILRDCSVIVADESEIPEKWRMSSLSSIRKSNNLLRYTRDPYCNIRSADFCIIDGEDVEGDGVFVDLVQNPERFTGYGGESSHRIWSAIYNENCFYTVGNPMKAVGSLNDEVCIEKKSFYRLLSGMHASISIHLCNEWLDRTTGKWGRNVTCFEERFKDHKDYIENLYFAYTILVRSVTKLVPFLTSSSVRSMCSAETQDVDDTLELLSKITDTVSLPMIKGVFNEKLLFQAPNGNEILDDIKIHFRNISMIMDCVACEKCRLWGKVQVTGIGTALKILFSFADDKIPSISRSELVALFNTVHRFSESILALFSFERSDDSNEDFAIDKKLSDVIYKYDKFGL